MTAAPTPVVLARSLTTSYRTPVQEYPEPQPVMLPNTEPDTVRRRRPGRRNRIAAGPGPAYGTDQRPTTSSEGPPLPPLPPESLRTDRH